MNRSRSAFKVAGIFFCLCPGQNSIAFASRLFLCFLISVVSTGTILSQTNVNISGYVYDAYDGNPLEQALVSVSNTGYSSLTDQFGFYAMENIPSGAYTLSVKCEGYIPEKSTRFEVVKDVERRVDFRLQRKIYDLGVTRVRSARPVSVPLNVEVIDRRDIRNSSAANLAEVLNKLEGVQVRYSGRGGGEARISIRGCAPEHVLVLLDGQRINPAGSDVADLNTVPLEMIEKVELFRGGESAQFGSGALGGVINIISRVANSQRNPEVRLGKLWGVWKTNNYSLSVSDLIPVANLSSRIAVDYLETRGDFDYHYTVSPRPEFSREYAGRRLNDDLYSRNLFASAAYQLSPQSRLSGSAHTYFSRQGLPGKVSNPDTTAWKTDSRKFINLHFEQVISKVAKLDLSAGFSRFVQYFNNRDHHRAADRYEDRFTDDVFNIQGVNIFQIPYNNRLKFGIVFERDILYHDNIHRPTAAMGRTVRDNFALFISDQQPLNLDILPFFKRAVIDFALRWDRTATAHDATTDSDDNWRRSVSNWSEKVGVSISSNNNPRLTIRSAYGTSYRLPSLNALFWKGDTYSQGNNELKPEQAEHSEIGCEIGLNWWAEISAGITYTHSHITDFIIWQPGANGAWKPVNLDAVLMTGHEEFITLSLFDQQLIFGYRNTITTPQNKKRGPNSFDNFLTYRPHYITSLEARWHYRILHGEYNIRWVDKRFANEANTKWYDAYRLDDYAIGMNLGFYGLKTSIDYRVKNANDEDYTLIGQYPMPGWEWSLEVAVSHKFE